jgi:hypothetical protein
MSLSVYCIQRVLLTTTPAKTAKTRLKNGFHKLAIYSARRVKECRYWREKWRHRFLLTLMLGEMAEVACPSDTLNNSTNWIYDTKSGKAGQPIEGRRCTAKSYIPSGTGIHLLWCPKLLAPSPSAKPKIMNEERDK